MRGNRSKKGTPAQSIYLLSTKIKYPLPTDHEIQRESDNGGNWELFMDVKIVKLNRKVNELLTLKAK